jgi:hypothetical membrane protein
MLCFSVFMMMGLRQNPWYAWWSSLAGDLGGGKGLKQHLGVV